MSLLNEVIALIDAGGAERQARQEAARREYAQILRRRNAPEVGDAMKLVELLPAALPFDGWDEATGQPVVPPHLRPERRVQQLRKDAEALEELDRLSAKHAGHAAELASIPERLAGLQKQLAGAADRQARIGIVAEIDETERRDRYLRGRLVKVEDAIATVRGRSPRLFV